MAQQTVENRGRRGGPGKEGEVEHRGEVESAGHEGAGFYNKPVREAAVQPHAGVQRGEVLGRCPLPQFLQLQTDGKLLTS